MKDKGAIYFEKVPHVLADDSDLSSSIEKIKVGYELVMYLKGFGGYTKMTAHETTADGVLFIFDNCVTLCPMNISDNRDGGYEKSELKELLNKDYLNAFPEIFRNHIKELTIPTIGQIIGWDNDEFGWNKCLFESDKDEQLPLMKHVQHRIGCFNGQTTVSYWLRNNCRNSSNSFVSISEGYNVSAGNGHRRLGVRPEFWLMK